MKRAITGTTIFLLVIAVFSQEYDSSNSSTPLQEKSETADTTDADVEIFGYSSSADSYQLLNPPPRETKKRFIIESPRKHHGTTGYSPYSSTPPAPDRPIGKTVVGIILSIQGGAATIIGMITLMAGATSGGGSPFLTALPILGPGLGMLIPGSAMVSQARSEWAYYNEWERKYGNRASSLPTFTVQYTFVF